MREIEFRGKRKDNDEWIYGNYVYEYPTKTHYITQNLKNCHQIIEIIPETIGEYTGLKDKNGAKIFEGDIIDINQTVNGYNQFVIEYRDYRFISRFYYQEKREIRGYYPYDLDEFFEINEPEKDIEVIGNIFDKEKIDE